MLEKPVNKFEISIVIILQIVIMVFLYIALKPPKTKLDDDIAEAVFQLKFNERVHQLFQENSEKAKQLSEKGQYKEAAILLLQKAAARECLFPDRRIGSKGEPTFSERAILREFQMASKEDGEVYKKILEWKYPDWAG